MKKLLWPLCAFLVLLSAFGVGLTAAYLTQELTYDQISGISIGPPARPALSIAILYEGDFPGMSDEPVTAQQTVPGQAALNVLQGQKYTRLFPLFNPRKNGIAIREIKGCTPFYVAYWDGKHLWLPGEKEDQWLGYVPSSPEELEERLQEAYKLQKEIQS